MKFITEDDLRDLYRKAPFTEYVIEPGTRITPGARQFLADRQIFLPDEEPVLTGRSINKQAGNPEKQAGNPDKQGSNPGKQAKEKTVSGKRLSVRMESMETLLLLMQMDIEEAFENCVDDKQCEEVTGKVNQIINTLSQMICYAAGGETCQRRD